MKLPTAIEARTHARTTLEASVLATANIERKRNQMTSRPIRAVPIRAAAERNRHVAGSGMTMLRDVAGSPAPIATGDSKRPRTQSAVTEAVALRSAATHAVPFV